MLGALVRWGTFAAILIAVGSIAFRFVVAGRAAIDGARRDAATTLAATFGVRAAMLILPCAVVRLYVQTDAMRFPDDPWSTVATNLLVSTSWGHVWIGQVLAAIVAGVAFSLAKRGQPAAWAPAALAAIALSSTPTLSSHAMDAKAYVAMSIATDWLHVLAAGTWLGALAVLFAVVRGYGDRTEDRRAIADLLDKFSPLALTGAGTVVVTGALSVLNRVQPLSALFTSTYGRLVCLKLAFVGVVAFLGWLNWKRNTPAVLASTASLVRNGMRAELATVTIVLAITAVLVTTSPPMAGMSMP